MRVCILLLLGILFITDRSGMFSEERIMMIYTALFPALFDPRGVLEGQIMCPLLPHLIRDLSISSVSTYGIVTVISTAYYVDIVLVVCPEPRAMAYGECPQRPRKPGYGCMNRPLHTMISPLLLKTMRTMTVTDEGTRGEKFIKCL